MPEGKLLINTINAHSYNTALKDAEFAEALLKGGALIPDGASMVLAFRWLRKESIERTAGWDLFEYEMERLNRKGGICYFLGSSKNTLKLIKEKAKTVYPNIRIETYSPPYKPEFTEEENQMMIDAINAVKPDLLWIGMTAPKQEKWAYTHLDALEVNGHIGTVGSGIENIPGQHPDGAPVCNAPYCNGTGGGGGSGGHYAYDSPYQCVCDQFPDEDHCRNFDADVFVQPHVR